MESFHYFVYQLYQFKLEKAVSESFDVCLSSENKSIKMNIFIQGPLS